MTAPMTILTEATVFTATGTDPFEGSVVVEGDKITAVVPTTAVLPAAGLVISLRGMTLLPGLIDAHVHAAAVEADIQDQHRRLFDSELAVLTAQSLTDMLRRGFTAVRDAGGADAGFRRLIERGTIAGPRLLVSGRPLSQTGGHGDKRRAMEPGAAVVPRALGMTHAVADGPDEVRRAVREELRRGADQIKVMAGGGVMSPTDRLESVQYSLEELRAAVAAATAGGSYVLAHAYTAEAIEVCVAAGVRSIEHGNLLTDRAAALMAEAGTFLVPTLVTYEKLYEQGADLGIPAANLDKLSRITEAGLTSLRIAQAAGVRIGSGSDLLGPMRRFQAREIALQADALGAAAAIIAATRTNAELLGIAAETGTIEAGKAADLVAVEGDPLAVPGLLGEAGRLAMVMRGGQIHLDRTGHQH
ncbi:MAG TPA: amidohydrolase family protein [Streptosporangiaceae bacterium]|jgi:imidazolonepropionase-like amidohydrolase